MKKQYIILTFFIYLLMSQFSVAQTYIWGGPGDPNSEFANGLNDWTVNTVSPNDSALWVWEADGKADKGLWWYDRPAIASPSVSNGAAVFDSDYYDNGGISGNAGNGIAPSPQKAELISPSFSCEFNDKVFVKFNQFYRKWHGNPKFAVSYDNGETWPFVKDLNTEILLNNSTKNSSIQLIDISEAAAHQAEVKIKFIWDAEYYFWIIDDVYVLSDPAPDPQILGTWYPVDRFYTPQNFLTHDSLTFKMKVHNAGANLDNGKAFVKIINRNTYETVYSDSTIYSINADDTLDVNFNQYLLESDIDTGLYYVSYIVDSDNTETQEKKEIHQYFRIIGNPSTDPLSPTSSRYNICDDNPDQAYSYQGSGADGPKYSVYHINYYKTGDWVDNKSLKYRINYLNLSVWMRTENSDDKISYPANMSVLEMVDSIKDDLSNLKTKNGFIVDNIDNDQLIFLGSGEFDFNNVDKYELVKVPVTDADAEEEYIELSPGKKFLLTAYWPSGTRYYQAVDNHYFGIERFYYPDQIMSFRYGDYGGGGQFYGISRDIGAWVMGFEGNLHVSKLNEADKMPDNSLVILQNPVTDILKLNISFKNTVKLSTLVIHNLNGEVINYKNLYNIQDSKQTIDIGNIPNGLYIATIFTKDKHLSKKFVIQH